MDNKEYAAILNEIATLTRVVGDNFFRVRAFSRAARMIEDLPQSVEVLIDTRRLDVLSGIGESIEEELQMIRITGASPRHQELLDRIGRDVMDLWEIPGLGIKRIQILYQELGIASVAALKRAAVENRLVAVPQFGKAVQDKILEEIAGWERGRGRRYPLPEARALAESVRLELLQMGDVDRAEIGGSIRRGKETTGDIDILVTSDYPGTVSRRFLEMPDVMEIIQEGETRCSVRITSEIQCDLRILDRDLFGAGLHYFTGNKDHHIQMRLRSKRMGLKISEKGVMRYDDPTETPIGPMNTEEEVFEAVGMQYVPPEIRMGKDEIRLGEERKIPELIERRHLMGDPNVYSSLSSGRESPEEFVDACAKSGYKWVVLSEKAGMKRAGGVRPGDFDGYLKKIAELNGRHPGLRVLSGLDLEILPDGLLDFDQRLLTRVDWVVARITQNVDTDAETNTQRIMWGFETGLVSCFAHPTGRHLGVHDGYAVYMDEMIDCANDFGVALEMSGHPQAFDLNAVAARRARERGASLVVSSSAGAVSGLSNVEYSLQQARRAWLKPNDILNTRSWDEVTDLTRVLLRH